MAFMLRELYPSTTLAMDSQCNLRVGGNCRHAIGPADRPDDLNGEQFVLNALKCSVKDRRRHGPHQPHDAALRTGGGRCSLEATHLREGKNAGVVSGSGESITFNRNDCPDDGGDTRLDLLLVAPDPRQRWLRSQALTLQMTCYRHAGYWRNSVRATFRCRS